MKQNYTWRCNVIKWEIYWIYIFVYIRRLHFDKVFSRFYIMCTLFRVLQNLSQLFCSRRKFIPSEDRYIGILWFRRNSCTMNVEFVLGKCLKTFENPFRLVELDVAKRFKTYLIVRKRLKRFFKFVGPPRQTYKNMFNFQKLTLKSPM